MTAATATLNGSISSNGNQSITSDGFDYGTTTSYGTHVTATTVQSGAFSVGITGLTSGTTLSLSCDCRQRQRNGSVS